MGIDSTDEAVDLDGENDTVGAAKDTAADPGSDSAAGDGAGDDSGAATGTKATTGTDDPADGGAGSGQSEAEQRKLPAARQSATNPNQPTNKGQPPKAGSPGQPGTGQPAAPVDPVKALNDERAGWGRERAKRDADQKALASRVEHFERVEQERKAEAQRQALKPWHPRHPDSAKTRDRIGRVSAFASAVNALPPEARTPEAKAQIARDLRVTNDDIKLHAEHEEHREDIVTRFSQDPEGYLDEQIHRAVPALIQNAFDQWFQHQRATADVERMMADPKKIAPHADMIRERVTSGSKLTDVMELVELRNRLAELEGGAAGAAGKTAEVERREKAAAERERLGKAAAGITRDSKTSGKPDFYAETLKESGKNPNDKAWQPGGHKFNKHMVKLEEAHRSAGDPG